MVAAQQRRSGRVRPSFWLEFEQAMHSEEPKHPMERIGIDFGVCGDGDARTRRFTDMVSDARAGDHMQAARGEMTSGKLHDLGEGRQDITDGIGAGEGGHLIDPIGGVRLSITLDNATCLGL